MTYGVNAPLGLVVKSYLGNGPFNGNQQTIQITPAYATSIFTGDLVTYSAGLLVRYTAGNTTGTMGIFNGCQYTDTKGVVTFSPYYPASLAVQTGSIVTAYVITDPNTEFTIQCTGAAVTANIDYNADVTFATAGNTATGLSGMALNTGTIAVTATLPLRILGFDTIPGNITGVTYNNVLVKLNQSAFIAGTTGV